MLIALAKIPIPHPHAHVGQSELEQRHELILRVIEFVHLSCLSHEIFALPEHLPQFSAVPFTLAYLALATYSAFFQLRLALAHLRVGCQLPRPQREVASLLCVSCCVLSG